MKNILKIVAFAVAFIVAKYAVQEFNEQRSHSNFESDFQKMREDAKEKHPDLTPLQAFQKEALEKSKNNILNSKTEWEKLNKASDTFIGFYLINTRGRKIFCDRLGIDISPFVRAFSGVNNLPYTKAKSVIEQSGISEEERWTMVEGMLTNMVAEDMQEIADTYNVSLVDVCNLFAESSQELVFDFMISNRMPEIYEALVGKQNNFEIRPVNK